MGLKVIVVGMASVKKCWLRSGDQRWAVGGVEHFVGAEGEKAVREIQDGWDE